MVTVIKCNADLVAPNSLLKESSPKFAIERLLHGPVEACSEYAGSVISTNYHAFMAALHAAFVDHRPFVLSPDMIWLLIAQGFANHVNEHAQEMRSRFVSHEGKKKLKVRRDDFIKGSPENPWEDVFDEFSTHIRKEIGESNHELIVTEFSTTGAIEKAANEVVLMDSIKAYFEYGLNTLCGIPEVRLEGTQEDWERLVTKTETLGTTYDVQWWTERILPRLKTLAAHSKGQGDPAFWRDIYKWNDGSGGPYINGWIVDFIPYVETDEGFCKNGRFHYFQYASMTTDKLPSSLSKVSNRLLTDEYANKINNFNNHGITTNKLPSGLSKVPFVWNYLGTKYEMEFIAGFTAFTQETDSFAVRPKIGWAVRDKAHYRRSPKYEMEFIAGLNQ